MGANDAGARSVLGSGGSVSLAASARIHLYEQRVRGIFGSAMRLGLHYDGSNHKGHDMQLGCALIPGSDRSAYLAPAAPFLFKPYSITNDSTNPFLAIVDW